MSRQRLFGPLFSTSQMLEVFSDEQRIQSMLDFEAALARAVARAGIAPAKAAKTIQAGCDAKHYAMGELAKEATAAGNVAIPLVKALKAFVAKNDPKAAEYVHWGATSQDAMDTGLVLQLRESLKIFSGDLAKLGDTLAKSAKRQAGAVMAGRTWLQQGPPVTLGLKIAGWLDAVDRHRERLRELKPRVLALQFGGAVGTLAALGERGPKVARALAEELDLELPAIPWHAQRDRIAEIATALGLLTGTLGKIGRDMALLMQTEVGEAFEPGGPGRGGSSTMPHKRNPVGAATMLAAGVRVPALVSVMLASMMQEHERGLGGWQAEWETLPEICLLAHGALARAMEIAEGLEADPERMSKNLKMTHGLILAEAAVFALAERMGRTEAVAIVEAACREAAAKERELAEVLLEDGRVSQAMTRQELEARLEPKNYLGSASQWIESVVAAHRGARK